MILRRDVRVCVYLMTTHTTDMWSIYMYRRGVISLYLIHFYLIPYIVYMTILSRTLYYSNTIKFR